MRKNQLQVFRAKNDQNLTVDKKKSLLGITNAFKKTKLISYQTMSEPWDISKVKRRALHLIQMKKQEGSFAEKVQLKQEQIFGKNNVAFYFEEQNKSTRSGDDI